MLKNQNLSQKHILGSMAALQASEKYSHTTCMLHFLTAPCLVLAPNYVFEIGSKQMNVQH